MALYVYIKKKNNQSILSKIPSPRRVKSHFSQKTLGIISLTFLFAGLLLLSQVLYPIVGWYLFVLPGYSTGINSPLANNFRPENSPFYPTLVKAQETISQINPDSSYNAATWFVGANMNTLSSSSSVKAYTLTIPKLKIESATVIVGGDDLKKSLVAWPTSAPPGAYGNNIIFGHSELPQFASPTNYSGIFTSVMDLEKDDPIFVDYDGVRYKFLVVEKAVVEPTDLSVLEQRFDSSYITLITCVPPGTVWKRGVVKGILTQI